MLTTFYGLDRPVYIVPDQLVYLPTDSGIRGGELYRYIGADLLLPEDHNEDGVLG
jgi:hypothetical protein